MAIVKIPNRVYLTPRDLLALVRYIIKPEKISFVHSNMLYYTEPHDISCNLITAQWLYNHQYFHQMNKTLAYHYILGFEPQKDTRKLSPLSILNIMQEICSLDCFSNINLLMGVHKTDISEFDHIHIIADTVNKVSGKRLFISREYLVDQFGCVLSHYQIPLIGYYHQYQPIIFSS